VNLGGVVLPPRLTVRLPLHGDRLDHVAVGVHVTPPGNPEQHRVLVLARAATLLVVRAGAGRTLDVDEVALRCARLRGHSPVLADTLDLSGASELATALLPCVRPSS
jgi:hypothetical protein